MKRESSLIVGLCVSVLLVVSCKECAKTIPVKDYIFFLENHKSILEERFLLGWSAESRTGNNEGYLLMYNYYDPTLNEIEDPIKYMDYCELTTGKTCQIYGYTNDTIALCKEWNINTPEYPNHIYSICKSIDTLIRGYSIDKVQFYRNGNCFFSSTQNGWNLVYRNDSKVQSIEEQEFLLINNGYLRMEDTNFWIQRIGRK